MSKLFDPKSFGSLNIVFQFGIIVISNVIVGGLLGYLLYKYAPLGKMWLVILLMLGVFSGLYQGILYLLKEAEKSEKIDQNKHKRNNNNDNSSID